MQYFCYHKFCYHFQLFLACKQWRPWVLWPVGPGLLPVGEPGPSRLELHLPWAPCENPAKATEIVGFFLSPRLPI